MLFRNLLRSQNNRYLSFVKKKMRFFKKKFDFLKLPTYIRRRLIGDREMRKRLCGLFGDEKGADLLEYSLLSALAIALITVAFCLLFPVIKNIAQGIVDRLEETTKGK